jgi:NAD+--dinitrogen-reductase ADP-D-ribosyltransferase
VNPALPVVNRCSVPPWELASVEFQDTPKEVELVGVRQSEPGLFRLLARLATPGERAEAFHEYLSARFQLDQWGNDTSPSTTLRHSYVRFLRGWSVDSNSRAGAVLKGWVESRFGLRPTWHGGVLSANEAARTRYLEDRMRGEAETMGLASQLDLLYMYCQDELVRRHPGERWIVLYRGTHDPQEYVPREARDGSGTIVELNNLSSFSSDREVAWEFGTNVWEAKVPLAKIVCFSGLLPRKLLDGEKEHMVLGGEYRVRKLRC